MTDNFEGGGGCCGSYHLGILPPHYLFHLGDHWYWGGRNIGIVYFLFLCLGCLCEWSLELREGGGGKFMWDSVSPIISSLLLLSIIVGCWLGGGGGGGV